VMFRRLLCHFCLLGLYDCRVPASVRLPHSELSERDAATRSISIMSLDAKCLNTANLLNASRKGGAGSPSVARTFGWVRITGIAR
jgi:hypothetical protein